MKRGYWGIGIYRSKREENIGTLFRSAHSFGADFCFTIERRWSKENTDTSKFYKHVPFYHYTSFADFKDHLPKGANLIGVELDETARPLDRFTHPESAIYLLGAEDDGIRKDIINECDSIIKLPGSICLNVAVAGSIVMYDRVAKQKG